MKLTGSYKLNVKKEHVWKALNNPNILKQCIPGCESFEKENDTVFLATATNQIGPMNATFSGRITLTNIQEIEETNSEGQKRINRAKIARHEAELVQLDRGEVRTIKELDYFLELMHELDIDQDYLDNFYKIENEEDKFLHNCYRTTHYCMITTIIIKF